MTLNTPSLSARACENWSRILVGALFLALAWRLLGDFLETSRTTDLLLLVGEALVVVLTCLRRPASVVDRRPFVRLVTGVSMTLPLLSQPAQTAPLIPETVAALLLGVGLLVVVGGKMSLGYSFGLLPANRGVMQRGLYRIVRHPIYLGYLLTHIPFLAAHPSGWNAAVLLVGDAALIVRALYEEQTLGGDPQYVRYCQDVRWRLVPGIC
jgi:protein-S-isoprenylcysteine O-methyltransferase Ste14